jgi:hypothetical protein
MKSTILQAKPSVFIIFKIKTSPPFPSRRDRQDAFFALNAYLRLSALQSFDDMSEKKLIENRVEASRADENENQLQTGLTVRPAEP